MSSFQFIFILFVHLFKLQLQTKLNASLGDIYGSKPIYITTINVDAIISYETKVKNVKSQKNN